MILQILFGLSFLSPFIIKLIHDLFRLREKEDVVFTTPNKKECSRCESVIDRNLEWCPYCGLPF